MPQNDEFDDLSINPTAESFAKLIGKDAMTHLSRQLGGRRLYIPHSPGADSPLAACIGLDAAQKIGQFYGGLTFDVPLQAGKRARVLDYYNSGVPVVRIPALTGVSLRTVRRWVNSIEAKEERLNAQPDLFK